MVFLFFVSALVIFQATLEMFTVTWQLQPLIVMFHLVGGLAIISLLWLIFLRYNKFNYFKPITDIRFDIPKRKIKTYMYLLI